MKDGQFLCDGLNDCSPKMHADGEEFIVRDPEHLPNQGVQL